MTIAAFFPTFVYQKSLEAKIGSSRASSTRLRRELLSECYQIKDSDAEGRKWSETHYPGGYTSYHSLSELFRLSSTFLKLKEKIDRHVFRYASYLDMDLKNHKLEMTQCWINIMPQFVCHSLHLHPLASVSGTYYVTVEDSELKFEDPRLACFMGSLPRTANARKDNQHFVAAKPRSGDVILFESWLRHEVPQNLKKKDRVSVSFNYNWF